VLWLLVCLDVAPEVVVEVILELPAHRVEGVAHRHMDVLMCFVRPGVMAHHERPTGHAEGHAHVELLALPVASVRSFDDHVAVLDAFVNRVEARRPLADLLLERGIRL
jgi:hypothetical protein